MSPSAADSPRLRIPDVDPVALQLACGGDPAALNALVITIQPGIFNFALRMLGQRDDALDATRDVLLRVVSHLASFRGESAFSTWVFRIARSRLLTASTRALESPEVSFDDIGARLAAGLTHYHPAPARLSPLDKAEARDVALTCTQGMLMALDREQRMAYVLDVVFGLTSEQAAAVVDVSAAAYRQRLSRATAKLHGFMQQTCGLVSEDASCRCHRQLPALRKPRAAIGAAQSSGVALPAIDDAAVTYDQLTALLDAVAVLRAQPSYVVPESAAKAIRDVMSRHGWKPDAESST